MDVFLYPSKDFGDQVERLSKARASFIVRGPAGEKRKDILLEHLAILGGEAVRERAPLEHIMRTIRIFDFYTAAGVIFDNYEMSYVDEGDLFVTFTPGPRNGSFLYKIGKYEEALAAFKSEAADGSTHALVWTGWMYFAGKGVDGDVVVAERYYRMAAEAGSIMGLHYLATLLNRTGRTVEAIPIFKEAAARKFAPSLYRLGRMYEVGNGVNRDDSKADALFREAESLGNLWARRRLARRMIRGVYGVSKILPGFKAFWNYCLAHFVIKMGDTHSLRLMD